MPTIGLAMIVKDEARVITRALNSVRPLIDFALICDTGSTDGTQEIVRDWLRRNEVSGTVIEEPWQNFGYNRSFVLAKLHDIDVDYAFSLDADETITITEDVEAIKQRLTTDCYHVPIRLGSTAYALPRITSNRLPFYYRGPAHEWPDCKTKFSKDNLAGLLITEVGGGAREKDPNTYRHDAKLLEQELTRTDLDPLELTRYTFYLAQSYRDCGELQLALESYQNRIALGGWHEEIYVSLLNMARLQERLKHPFHEIIATYKRAIALNPKRAEAIHGATKALRLAGFCHEGYVTAEDGLKLPLHKGLFVETWIYDWGLLDEFSICAYYAGQRTVSLLAMQLLLCKDNLDDVHRKRITTNAAFALR